MGYAIIIYFLMDKSQFLLKNGYLTGTASYIMAIMGITKNDSGQHY